MHVVRLQQLALLSRFHFRFPGQEHEQSQCEFDVYEGAFHEEQDEQPVDKDQNMPPTA